MGWAPFGLRSMIASRRNPSARPERGSAQSPESSGPRCANVAVIGLTMERRSASDASPGCQKPVMPHITLGLSLNHALGAPSTANL